VRKSRPTVDSNVTDLLSTDAVLRLPRWPERTAWPRTSRMVCCVIQNQSHGYVATSRAVSCQIGNRGKIPGKQVQHGTVAQARLAEFRRFRTCSDRIDPDPVDFRPDFCPCYSNRC